MRFTRSSYRLIAVALSFSATALLAAELTIGYQTGVQPSVLAQAQGEFEKNTQATLHWQRGDIDGAFVWDPALGVAKQTGQVLLSAADLAANQSPVLDVWVVRQAFAQAYPQAVTDFTDTVLQSYANYRENTAQFLDDPQQLQLISRVSGAKSSDIAQLLAGNQFPVRAEQAALLTQTLPKAMADTADFLHAQGQLTKRLADYSAYITTDFVVELQEQ